MIRGALLTVFVPSLAFAQATVNVPYQGRLTDSTARPVDGVLQITFSLHHSSDADADPTALWTATHSLGLTDGYYSTYLPLPLESLDRGGRYLELSIGGQPLRPRQEIGWAPYAAVCRSAIGGRVATEQVRVTGAHPTPGSGRLSGLPQSSLLTGDGATRLTQELEPGDIIAIDPSGDNLLFQVLSVSSDAEVAVAPAVAGAGFINKTFTIQKVLLRASLSGGAPALTLASDGSAGYGTATPKAKLHVEGDALLGGVRVRTDQGGSLELGVPADGVGIGRNPVTGGVPYIDFHYGNGKAEDFNARLINDGDQHLRIQAANVAVSGNLQVAGTLQALVEASRKVGDPGQPSYLNSWSDWPDGRFDVGAHFYKVSSTSEVALLGLVKIPNPIQSATMFVLPAGYRPAKNKIFSVAANDVFAMVEVSSDGSVSSRGSVAAGGWVSLSGIRFRAEQ
jgi:hypothetical protein